MLWHLLCLTIRLNRGAATKALPPHQVLSIVLSNTTGGPSSSGVFRDYHVGPDSRDLSSNLIVAAGSVVEMGV